MVRKVVMVCLLATVVHGYSTGAPKDVCGDMVPRHPGTPQKTDPPFSLTLDKNKISANGIVQVKLSANNGGSFKGYFVQGRIGNTPVGAFEAINGVNLVGCGNGRQTGATHSNSDDKQVVILKWRAPKGLSESVYFNTTVVQDGATYWVGLLSSRLDITAN